MEDDTPAVASEAPVSQRPIVQTRTWTNIKTGQFYLAESLSHYVAIEGTLNGINYTRVFGPFLEKQTDEKVQFALQRMLVEGMYV